jgi:hypothetical protein
MDQNLTPTKWIALIVVKVQQNMENGTISKPTALIQV